MRKQILSYCVSGNGHICWQSEKKEKKAVCRFFFRAAETSIRLVGEL